MRASNFEYRHRFLLHAVIFTVGFWPFWEPWFGLPTKSTWLMLSASMARAGWLSFQSATVVLLCVAILFTTLAAWFRVWGLAYIGVGTMRAPSMRGESLQADGPYRRTRNPLYLGILLHAIGISLLMAPAASVLVIAAIWTLEFRLALAEEPFLESRFGEQYRQYVSRVPRFLPAPKPQVPAAGQRPRWLLAVAGEIYFVGAAVTLIAFGWEFNALPLEMGMLISLGLYLLSHALLPDTQASKLAQPARS